MISKALVLLLSLLALSLAQAPGCTVDLAFVVDTSPSMTDDIASICGAVTNLQTSLPTLSINILLYGLRESITTAGCPSNPAPNPTNVLALANAIGTGGFDPTCYPFPLGDQESWGWGSYIACRGTSWRSTASARVVIAASDEGICNGDPCDSQDRTSAASTGPLLASTGCLGFALVPTNVEASQEACLVQTATTWANASSGRVFRIRQDATQISTDIQAAIIAIATAACPTVAPTVPPTLQPTPTPTVAPTNPPTPQPTSAPTTAPTTAPTIAPVSYTHLTLPTI
eukprot:TRINITY_DN2254_c0_g2_i3.p1 TRINITY_DN2254_c0_g2~~TRINITY_DN2254_c0_g2_i3.p1  ORF type:complete len:286 (+),score=53.13 TRINITY_DN2254_c0_g2_i3:51-908(+)